MKMLWFVILLWIFWMLMSLLTGLNATGAMIATHALFALWLLLPEPNYLAEALFDMMVDSLRPLGGFDDHTESRVQEIQKGLARKNYWLALLNNLVMVLCFGSFAMSMVWIVLDVLPR